MYQQSITILDEIIQDSNSRIGLVSCDEAQGVVVKCQVAVLVTSNRYTSPTTTLPTSTAYCLLKPYLPLKLVVVAGGRWYQLVMHNKKRNKNCYQLAVVLLAISSSRGGGVYHTPHFYV